MRHVPAFIILVLLTRAVLGQAPLSAGSLVERTGARRVSGESHAWYIVTDTQIGRSVVYHLPPRRGGSEAVEGSIRFANDLLEAPAAVGARGDTLYLLFESMRPGPAFAGSVERSPRRMLAMRVVESTPGRWDTMPVDRLEVCPPLPGVGELVGLAGSDAGLFGALAEPTGTTVYVLGENAWTAFPGPQPWPRDAKMFGVPGGVGVLIRESTRARLGIAEVDRGTRELAWTWTELQGREREIAMRDGACAVACEKSVLIGSADGEGTFAIVASALPPGPSSWREIGVVTGVPRYAAMTALDTDGRIVVLWTDLAAGKPAGYRTTQVREFSVGTGRLLYAGEARITSPVTRADYLLLAISMVWIVGSIAIGVWNPREGAVVLPEETSLAEPPRRGIASLIDLAIAMSVAAMVRGAPTSEALTVMWWVTPEGLLSLVWALGGLAIGGAILEAVAGRTVGKMLTGCRVVSVIPPDRRPSHRVRIGQALVRNVVKWGLPPIGMMALFDPSGRPRADQIARTAVVVRIEPEVEDEE
ncbi:hypothetical protein PHYC_02772 [Phycisphaerales bacterium]|nr:hypothetical protein PHYC_02772 [Phycisphaerales bacterium]